ncbi:aminotransferase class I/II-fold pyridoxal phosphate-dependent enzyme [Clostridium sp. SHJSY1]|uniref:aminotransferase class I/II-fold pyridoxal phosphate-dependent enzyme n=1 Tax=Clostridium sp. SHJSY1 TaxID=2942483 RepID=UPI002875CA31|nr:aminotransferase class I/II-fold pyridoxal phosphate-dependent enzyme [Clostridium sp. SHJSY1]MDS0524649.1 aminotransferase class I/II-fold pyridoxal phosphate-dependent enzyme [Clostridium sp. SHJSY1]
MKKKLPLLQALLDYHKEENIIYSMPGNKAGEAFRRDEIGKIFANKLGYLDITEVDPLDNLHHPEGVIKDAQEALAKTYGVKKAYFLVNGTTGGNLASIFALFNEGDEVLVERNCHRSIYNGLILRKLKVTYIKPKEMNEYGLFLPPDKEDIYKALNKANNPKGIILTYPNYYGITYDLRDVLIELKERGLKIIIDEAHGAHFGISEKLPINIANLADFTIVSAHKTLPALTGGSFLLSNNLDSDIEFYISSFMTTSPSYLIMASLDYARYYLDNYGKEDYNKLIFKAEHMKEKITYLNKVKILSKGDLPKGYDIDLSRYVVIAPKGYSGYRLLGYLRENHIQAEMNFSQGVVLILSPTKVEENLNKLYEVLSKLDLEDLKDDRKIANYKPIQNEKAFEPFEVFRYEYEKVKVKDSVGRVLKESIVPYPPGIPIACPGEIVSNEIIENIINYLKLGQTILGIEDGAVKVCK